MRGKNKALFIDIDGTVIQDKGYVSKPQDLKLLPGVSQTLIKAQKAGFFLVFHSNKGGAFEKKGLTNNGLKKLDAAFKRMLARRGVDTTRISTYYCSHYTDKEKRIQCTCRKPKTGLFGRAIRELDIDAKTSSAIGDKISDLTPGINVLLKRAILVKRNGDYFDVKESGEKIGFARCNNLSEALDLIFSSEQKAV